MTQVIFNLVGNAIKFTLRGSIKLYFGWKPEGEATAALTTEYETVLDTPYKPMGGIQQKDYSEKLRKVIAEEKGSLIIKVTDTGSGIKKENQNMIFDKFAQVNDKSELKRLGLGLGLWISKMIASFHRGSILLDSKEGIGSCFTVSIPASCVPLVSAARASISPHKITSNTSIQPTNGPLRALVVEDFPINQNINAEMLKKCGFQEIEIASNGKEGVEIFKDRGPNFFDLITMDLEMPVMKGKDAILEIRRFERLMLYSPTKIVIISGNAIEKEIKECTDPVGLIQADRFLAKPCDFKTLVATLESIGIEHPVRGDLETEKMNNKKRRC